MPSFCAVLNCGMRGDRDRVRFFKLPAVRHRLREKLSSLSKERREAWIRALRRSSLSESQLKYARICSKHFISGAAASLEDKDNVDWIPNQNMGYSEETSQTQANGHETLLQHKRTKLELRVEPRVEHSEESDTATFQDPVPETSRDETECANNYADVAVQTDLSASDLRKLFKDLSNCNARIFDLEQRLEESESNKHELIIKLIE